MGSVFVHMCLGCNMDKKHHTCINASLLQWIACNVNMIEIIIIAWCWRLCILPKTVVWPVTPKTLQHCCECYKHVNGSL